MTVEIATDALDLDHKTNEVLEGDVARLRRRFDDAMAALDACDRVRQLSMGRRPAALVYWLVCVDE